MGFTYGPTAAINGVNAQDNNGTGAHPEVFFTVTGVGADSMSMISGNGQTGPKNAPGAQPMVVEIRDAAGLPVAGRTVQWSVSVPPGAAIADAPSSITDAAGRASMTFTYGSGGISSVIVANDGVTGQQVLFNMTALESIEHRHDHFRQRPERLARNRRAAADRGRDT